MTGPPGAPRLQDIEGAAARIRPWVHRTPVLTSSGIDDMAGTRLFFKCENFQRAGAFKFRGAANAVLSLTEEEAARGVAAHSSGNHAAALCLAARLRGIAARIVMPEGSVAVKKAAVVAYGGTIVTCENSLASREETLARVLAETGMTEIHPYDDARVIAGQGTAALELIEEVPDLDAVVAPVGGGGLLSGTAIAVAGKAPGAGTIGAEPAAVDDAARSFRSGELTPVGPGRTVADGLRTSLADRTLAVIREHVHDVATVSEEAIVSAMRLAWERMKILIEPSAAVPLAALLDGAADGRRRVGVILSGGNVDLDDLPWTRSLPG